MMNKRVVILGAGESGVGAALLAQQQNYDVFVSDYGSIKPNYKAELAKANIIFEEGGHTLNKILNANVVVKSPGIADKIDVVKHVNAKKINCISEIEFAYQYVSDATIIAITGSNGKTTTTSLIYDVFKKEGLEVALGGNIGKSFARQVAEKNYAFYVLEISSFQLDGIKTFKPNIAILLNITEDHLDRYEYKFENYIQSKFKIIKNQTTTDSFIYCADDEIINQHLNSINVVSTKYPFSIKETVKQGAYLNENEMLIKTKQNQFNMSIYELGLQGKHNVYNSMAATIASSLLNIRKDTIRNALRDFTNLEHRLEKVLKVAGVEYVNDSKATNVNSTWYALETMEQPVIWIVGGVDKGNDYNLLKELVEEKVKYIICLGEDVIKIHNAFASCVNMILNASSMQEAVVTANQLATKGDVVLLSPACASFDLFDNYEDRGKQFKQNVRNL